MCRERSAWLVRLGAVLVGSVAVLGMFAGVAWSASGWTAYVTNAEGDTVTPITIATNTPGTAIALGADPMAVVVTPDQAPTEAFSLAAAPADSPSTFDGSASSSPVGSIASYEWDFGDGQHATTTNESTTHVYAAPGIYTAGVTVTNSAGTSLAQVFTGQSVSLQGGPQASTTRTITIPAVAPRPTLVAHSLTHVDQSRSSWREGNRSSRPRRRGRSRGGGATGTRRWHLPPGVHLSRRRWRQRGRDRRRQR